jgi:hypothetical protein
LCTSPIAHARVRYANSIYASGITIVEWRRYVGIHAFISPSPDLQRSRKPWQHSRDSERLTSHPPVSASIYLISRATENTRITSHDVEQTGGGRPRVMSCTAADSMLLRSPIIPRSRTTVVSLAIPRICTGSARAWWPDRYMSPRTTSRRSSGNLRSLSLNNGIESTTGRT